MSSRGDEIRHPLRPLLRVGMHKTGSTALQFQLFSDADRLKEIGILPAVALRTREDRKVYDWALTQKRKPAGARRPRDAHLSGASTA